VEGEDDCGSTDRGREGGTRWIWILDYWIQGLEVLEWSCTVCKMDLILRSIQWRPQMKFSMACRFKLQLLRRYNVEFYKMRNFTLGSP
jgi:hypothetical protein